MVTTATLLSPLSGRLGWREAEGKFVDMPFTVFPLRLELLDYHADGRAVEGTDEVKGLILCLDLGPIERLVQD